MNRLSKVGVSQNDENKTQTIQKLKSAIGANGQGNGNSLKSAAVKVDTESPEYVYSSNSTAQKLRALGENLQKIQSDYEQNKQEIKDSFHTKSAKTVDKAIANNMTNSSAFYQKLGDINSEYLANNLDLGKNYEQAKNNVKEEIFLALTAKKSALKAYNYDKVLQLEEKIASLSESDTALEIMRKQSSIGDDNSDSRDKYDTTVKFLALLDRDSARTYLDNGRKVLLSILGEQNYNEIRKYYE